MAYLFNIYTLKEFFKRPISKADIFGTKNPTTSGIYYIVFSKADIIHL